MHIKQVIYTPSSPLLLAIMQLVPIEYTAGSELEGNLELTSLNLAPFMKYVTLALNINYFYFPMTM